VAVVFNAIVPAQPWAQTFRFPAGAIDFAGGEKLRANFRRASGSPLIFAIDEPGGIVRTGNDYSIQLTNVQTTQLDGMDRVSFDLYAVKAGVTRALQLRVHVPVVDGL
jgi:hypothetical protein